MLCTSGLFAMAQAPDSLILLTIDGKPVTKGEFEAVYRKNNTHLYDKKDKKTPKEYLQLFINFKLKVMEAERLKMDTSQTFINELAGYRKEVAAPYLTDHNYTEQLVREIYDRMSKEINASHILLRLSENASPEEEQKVLRRINDIRQEILDGKDFGQAAVEYSEDPSAQTNRGNLGYFSAFTMVYPFENAAYQTPLGQISEPVRTRFGYHLIKVNDIRPNRGEIKVGHIMKAFPRNASAETKQKLKEEIEQIYHEIMDGADFAKLAKEKSDDRRTAAKGGETPWFSAGQVIPKFADVAFALKNIGDVSKPFETQYGFHIVKKLDEKKPGSFEEMRADIERRIEKDPERSGASRKRFVARLKQEYHFHEIPANIQMLANKEIGKGYQFPDSTLFRLNAKNYTIEDFNNWLKEKHIRSGQYLAQYEPWVVDEVIAYEDARLEQKYPEFKYLMQEYHDGILLFNISQEKIWDAAVRDSTGLENFYRKHRKKHRWQERFKGYIIRCKTAAIREELENLLASGLSIEEAKEHINTDEEYFTAEQGAWEQGDNPIVDYYVWNGPEPSDFDSSRFFIRGDKIAPQPKTLDEARGLYIADYQKFLEKKWLKELRKKYKVRVNKKVLKSIESV